MPRTLLTSLVPAVVIATVWLRLESPINEPLRSVAVAGLAVLPALVRPLAARIVALALSAATAMWIAYGVSPLHPRNLPGAIWSRFSGGFLDFYDVKTPFDPRVHAEMRAVLLTAVFGFALAVALAVAARRPIPALLLLLAGAGWPATLRGPAGGLQVGGLILLGALSVLAGLTSRNVPRVVIPAAIGLTLAALAASTSSAVAKGGLVSWQHWDFTAGQPAVSVAFVWNAQYAGIHFPRKRTTVLEVKAPQRSLYWRAAVLDDFVGDRWAEGPALRGDALEPLSHKLLRQDVQVLALSDTHLVGASVPVRFDAGDAPLVSNVPGVAEVPSGLTRGFRYTVWSDAPQPTAVELAHSKPIYPNELIEPGTFLDVGRGITMPPFGRPRIFRSELERYASLERTAVAVAGKARTPYGAAVALMSFFRSSGGFVYTNQPPPPLGATAPLVDFVTRTRAGYCQHFAGAMALMLRYLGVPARVAVGFSSGTYDVKSGIWRVTDHDAHAWVEVWFRGYGWLPFDPTPAARPGRGQLSAPYAAAAERTGSGTATSLRAVGTGPSDPRQSGHRHGDASNRRARGAGSPALGRAPGSHGSLLLLLALVLGATLAVIVVAKIAVRRARYLTRDPRRLATACRQELADYLVDQQIDSARSATLHELGALVRHELVVEPDAFVAAATAARFGPPAGSERAARTARRELRALIRSMRRRLRVRDRLRGIVSLRSFGLAP